MTSPTNRTDEVAREVVDQFDRLLNIRLSTESYVRLTNAIASAITSAVEQERARCINAVIDTDISPSDTPFEVRKNFITAIRQTPTQERS